MRHYAIVVVEKATEALRPSHGSTRRLGANAGDQVIPEALMIALHPDAGSRGTADHREE